MATFASTCEAIRTVAAQTLEHCPYRSGRRIDISTGAISLTQALILAAGGTVRSGRAWASEPVEASAREPLHAVARDLLAQVGVRPSAHVCPTRVLARWERAVDDPAAVVRLVGAHPEACRHLRLSA
jgi:hypothetical protein